VAGEGLGYGVAGEAADGGDGGVAQDVSGYRNAVGPVQARAGAVEDGVVAPRGDWWALAGSEHRVVWSAGASFVCVVCEQGDQGWGERLLAVAAAFLT
jgi:hypothetical protein